MGQNCSIEEKVSHWHIFNDFEVFYGKFFPKSNGTRLRVINNPRRQKIKLFPKMLYRLRRAMILDFDFFSLYCFLFELSSIVLLDHHLINS